MNTTECPSCLGHGTVINTFCQVRRCGTCKGRKMVAKSVADKINAIRIYCDAKANCADRSLAADATLGLDLLRHREPEREAKMITSILAGRTTDVIRALAAYYRAAYPA